MITRRPSATASDQVPRIPQSFDVPERRHRRNRKMLLVSLYRPGLGGGQCFQGPQLPEIELLSERAERWHDFGLRAWPGRTPQGPRHVEFAPDLRGETPALLAGDDPIAVRLQDLAKLGHRRINHRVMTKRTVAIAPDGHDQVLFVAHARGKRLEQPDILETQPLLAKINSAPRRQHE